MNPTEGAVETRTVRVGPEPSIADLIGRLTDDSKRLVGNEVRLARLELGESMRLAVRGAIRLALGFGVAILALVGLTVLLTSVIGMVLLGSAWAGALVTGALEIIVGGVLLWRGTRAVKEGDFTLGESRAELRATVGQLTDTVSRTKVRLV